MANAGQCGFVGDPIIRSVFPFYLKRNNEQCEARASRATIFLTVYAQVNSRSQETVLKPNRVKEKIKYATVAQLVEQTFAGETTAAGGR